MKSLFLMALFVWPMFVYGQTTLTELNDFADRVCQRAPLEGRSSNSELSAGAKADLTGFLKNVLGLGFDVRASRKDSSFSGVQQDRLADALAKGNECRAAVVHDFRDLVLRAPTSVPQTNTNMAPRQNNRVSPPIPRTAPCNPLPIEIDALLGQNDTQQLRSLPAPNIPPMIQPKTVEVPLGGQQMVWPGIFVTMNKLPGLSEQPLIIVMGTGKMKSASGFCETGQQIRFSPASSRTIVASVDEVTPYRVTITFNEDR